MPIERAADFSADVAAWEPVTLGQANLALSSVSAGRLPALRMDFDFKGGGGFVVARRVVHRAMHEDYVVRGYQEAGRPWRIIFKTLDGRDYGRGTLPA